MAYSYMMSFGCFKSQSKDGYRQRLICVVRLIAKRNVTSFNWIEFDGRDTLIGYGVMCITNTVRAANK